MVQIPRYEAQDNVGRAAIGGVSSSPSFVAPQGEGAKAMRYDKISSSIGQISREASRSLDAISQRSNQEKLTREAVETARYVRELNSQAAQIEDDAAVLPFVQEGMQKRLDQLNEKYAGRETLQQQMFIDTQRSAIKLENNMFNFVERRQAERHIATMDEFLFEKKSDLLSTSSEVDRATLYQEMDGQIDEAEKLGYLSAVRSGEMKRNIRREGTRGIIVNAIANDNPGYAAAYLAANREFLSPSDQAGMTVSIKNKRKQLASQADRAQKKSNATHLLGQMHAASNEYAAERAVSVMGVDPGDHSGIYAATGGKATSTERDTVDFVSKAAESGKPDMLTQHVQEIELTAGAEARDVRMMELAKAARKNPAISAQLQVINSTDGDPSVKYKLQQHAIDLVKPGEYDHIAQNYAAKEGLKVTSTKAITGRAQQELLKNTRFQNFMSAMSGAPTDNNDPFDQVVQNQQRNVMAQMVVAHHAKQGAAGELDKSIEDVVSFLPRSYIEFDGALIPVPAKADRAGMPTLSPGVIRGEIKRQLKSINPKDIVWPDQSKNTTEAKKKLIESGDISVRPYPHPSGTKIVLTNSVGDYIFNKSGVAVVADMIDLQDNYYQRNKNENLYKKRIRTGGRGGF